MGKMKIHELAKKLNLNSKEVLERAKELNINVKSHLSAIERGERKPTLETLYRISRALDIKMSTIIIKLEEELEKNEK